MRAAALGGAAMLPVILALMLPLMLGAGAAAAAEPGPQTGPQAGTKTNAGALDGKLLLRRADSGSYDSDKNVISVEGHVEFDYDGRILLADKVTYDVNADTLVASGHVSMMNEKGDVAFADRVELKDKMRDGVLSGFGALLGNTGRLAAVSANRREKGRITQAQRAVYSNCKICNLPGERTPLWQIKAFSVVHDNQTHRISFTDATLEFMGVPILYTPYLDLPDPTVTHASGLLTPDTGSSSSIGYFIGLPYYFSISPDEDATIEPMFTTDGGTVLFGEYRKRWENSGMWLQGSIAENPNGGIDENQSQYYAHLFGSGKFALSDGWQAGQGWQAGFDSQITSKDTYLKRYDISQADRLTSDLFLVGESGRSRLAVSGYFFQSLRLSDDNKTFPVPLPLIEYSYVPLDKWLGGQFEVDVNSAVLSRDIGVNDQRLTTEASWRWPFVFGNGQLWTFRLDGRSDLYHTDTPTTDANKHYIWRGLPTASLDWRWPFIARGGGERSVIVEPIAQLIASPYGGNPDTIPNEDSYGLGLDDNNLFSLSQVPGYDLLDSGPKANFGVRTEARFSGGYVEALLGQSLRLKHNSIFDDDTGLHGNTSDLVGRFSIKFLPYFDLTQRVAYDEKDSKIRRNEMYLTGIYGRSSIQTNYIHLSKTSDMPKREEINGQLDVNFYANWQAFAAVRRDLIANQTLSSEFGLGYEDECFGISLAYRRKYTSDRDLKPSTALLLHFNLKTTDQPIQPFSLFPQDVFSYTHS